MAPGCGTVFFLDTGCGTLASGSVAHCFLHGSWMLQFSSWLPDVAHWLLDVWHIVSFVAPGCGTLAPSSLLDLWHIVSFLAPESVAHSLDFKELR